MEYITVGGGLLLIPLAVLVQRLLASLALLTDFAQKTDFHRFVFQKFFFSDSFRYWV
jgi:hypothetical protein